MLWTLIARLICTSRNTPKHAHNRKADIHSRHFSAQRRKRIKPTKSMIQPLKHALQRVRGETKQVMGETPPPTGSATASANRPTMLFQEEQWPIHTHATHTKSSQRNRCPKGNNSLQPRLRSPTRKPIRVAVGAFLARTQSPFPQTSANHDSPWC